MWGSEKRVETAARYERRGGSRWITANGEKASHANGLAAPPVRARPPDEEEPGGRCVQCRWRCAGNARKPWQVQGSKRMRVIARGRSTLYARTVTIHPSRARAGARQQHVGGGVAQRPARAVPHARYAFNSVAYNITSRAGIQRVRRCQARERAALEEHNAAREARCRVRCAYAVTASENSCSSGNAAIAMPARAENGRDRRRRGVGTAPAGGAGQRQRNLVLAATKWGSTQEVHNRVQTVVYAAVRCRHRENGDPPHAVGKPGEW